MTLSVHKPKWRCRQLLHAIAGKAGSEAALRGLCETHDLWFQRDEETGIYRISTAAEYRRDIQSFRAAEIEVFTLLYPNAYDVALAVRDLFGDRVRLGDRAQAVPGETAKASAARQKAEGN